MASARKKTAAKTVSKGSGTGKTASSAPAKGTADRSGARQTLERPGQRKRGWRDIEAMSERARLKKLLTDIWHEDIELEEDIFGESDHLAGYYTDSDDEEEPVEPDEDAEYDDFEEDED